MPRADAGTAVGVETTRTPRDPGFTLIEIVIAVAVVAVTVAAGVGISLGSRSYAVAAAAAEFDHFLDSARTIARETQGATLAFEPDAYGDGTEVRVLAPGPNGTLTATTLPIFHTRAIIEETESLGKVPFAFVVHASGSLGGRPGFRRTGTALPAEVGCPARGSFHFTIHTAGATADRFIPCRITLASNGPVAFATWPPATVAPLPTPCAGSCTPTALPTAPSGSPTCPPNYAVTSNGCTQQPPVGSGPRYHVTATLASPTMVVGGSDSITAQATLVGNQAGSAAPLTVPVTVQTSTPVCSIMPNTAQPSSTPFTLSALLEGACIAIVEADISNVPAAAADSVSLEIPVTPSASQPPGPSPSVPPTCDLVANGKCYVRFIDRTSQTFWKYVVPDTRCEIRDGVDSCSYIDSIRLLTLAPGYAFKPPVATIDPAHEILIKIDRIGGIFTECQPFSFVGSIPGGDPIPWGGNGIGTPADASDGFGEPSVYLTLNHVIATWTSGGGGFNVDHTWQQGTTLPQLYDSVAFGKIGAAYSFTYSDVVSASPYLQWYPDFPGCDVGGDPTNAGLEFGNAGLSLVFEIFQAVP